MPAPLTWTSQAIWPLWQKATFREAAAIVRQELPFPAILGYVCPAYCEPVCRRGDVDEPIAICATHRFIADESERRLQPGPSTGKRVAVVGAGFGGLSAAWFLVASGHRVTVYDSADTGGMSLRNEVAEVPLTDEAIERELRPLWDAGARFIGGRVPVCDLDLRTLLDAGFDAVVRGSGPSGASPYPFPTPVSGAEPDPRPSNAFTGRTREDGIFAMPPSPTDSVIHRVAGGKRVAVAVDAWLSGEKLEELEEKLAAFSALPYLDQLRAAEDLGPVGGRLAVRSPVWLKMGIKAAPAQRVDTEPSRELTPGSVRAEAQRCLQCVCPSLGTCDLQKLGVEYGITENKLVTVNARVRDVRPQHEHPFIRRDMDRCIACGRCVRVCRDVAGPACYDFTGRGFTINVDTPYGDALQLAGCIRCGRCVTSCPTGALTFNERRLTSFRLDENRCIACEECVGVCPVGALGETSNFEDARRSWHEILEGGSGLAGGHRMCAGCGAPIVVRQVLMGTSDPVVISSATGCLEVSTTIYPYTSWKSSFIHSAFENSAATLSGVETAFRALQKKGLVDDNVRFIAFGGDGGTYDIGLQSLSGAMERGHRMLYVCYDNGAYMNTGFQRSGATPVATWTTTSPVGEETAGKLQHRKNLTEIMVAHGLEYVAQASPHDPRDLVRKAAKALAVDGPTFLNVLSPCPRGWRAEGAETIDLAREAVNTCYWPLFEVEDGEYHLTYRPHHKLPLTRWLKRQGRFAHLFKPGGEQALATLENWVDEEWESLLKKCNEPSEAEWQARIGRGGRLLEDG